MKNTKKGFTLVELLVVIAIVAILATVAVIGYTAFIEKANLSVDQQLATQMNTALNGEAVTNVPENVDEVLVILANAGFNTEEGIAPSTKGYTYYWYQKHNVIVLVKDEDGSVFCPVEDEQMVADFNADYAAGKVGIFALNKQRDPNLIPTSELPYPQIPNPQAVPYTLGENSHDTDFIEEINEFGWLYSFSTNDTGDENSPLNDQYEAYKNWIADFYILANDDFAGDSMGIIGQYWEFDWIPLQTPDDVEAGFSFLLLNDIYGAEWPAFKTAVTYEVLVEQCNAGYTFNCGAYNLSEENVGKSITVELRLYEPVLDEDGYVVDRTGRYIVCESFILIFDEGEIPVNRP